jgi:uncharacterized protein
MDELYEVRESSIDNKGVFAIKLIPKGTKVIQYTGEIFEENDPQLDERYKEQISNGKLYLFELDDNRCIDGSFNGNDAKYVNHSCDPNCEVEIENDEIWYIALRDINPYEEITVDYKFDETPPIDICRCGCKNCRGLILSEEALKNHKKAKFN